LRDIPAFSFKLEQGPTNPANNDLAHHLSKTMTLSLTTADESILFTSRCAKVVNMTKVDMFLTSNA